MDTDILYREDITENVIAIKVNHSYKEDISEAGLYDITRGYWKISIQRAERAEYAFSVYKGIIKEVYKIEKWLPAGSVPRPTLPDAEVPEGRYEFVGEIAEDEIRNKYIGKSMANLYRWGEANPIKYFFAQEPWDKPLSV
ncbi:MAG: hypothetical protein NC548_38690 [Lachnospiraceae bacterium]|nr:hypothetical protein [Lachnospiraceae bacterium]